MNLAHSSLEPCKFSYFRVLNSGSLCSFRLLNKIILAAVFRFLLIGSSEFSYHN